MRFIKTAWPLALALGLGACLGETGQQAPPGEAPNQAAAQVRAPEAAAKPPPSPDRLIGLSDKEITKLFAKPSLKRREAGAEFWQYSGPGCVMDLYFYADGEVKRVSYVTLRDPQTGRVGADACQDRLARLNGN